MTEQEFNSRYDSLKEMIDHLYAKLDATDIFDTVASMEIGEDIHRFEDEKSDLVIEWRRQQGLPA